MKMKPFTKISKQLYFNHADQKLIALNRDFKKPAKFPMKIGTTNQVAHFDHRNRLTSGGFEDLDTEVENLKQQEMD